MPYELNFPQKAAKSLKNCWQPMLLAALICSVPSLVAQVITSRTGQGFLTILYSLSENPAMSVAEFETILTDWFNSTGIIAIPVNAAAWTISPALMVGLFWVCIKCARGEQVNVTDVFSRLRCAFKAIFLNIQIFLRAVLALLPGWFLAGFGVWMYLSSLHTIAIGSVIMMLITSFGSAMAVILCIRVIYKYLPAMFMLAENPALPTKQCLAACRMVMPGKRRILFFAEMSCLFLSIFGSAVADLLASVFGNVIADTLWMAAGLAIMVYRYTIRASFFDLFFSAKDKAEEPQKA